MRRKNILIVLFLVSSFLSKAQVKTNLNAIVPKSPEATAMEKVNSVDVSSYTGAASLSIPLLTLEDKNMKLPVQLAYSASGLRLDQLGSSVGMGWTQTGGGVVSRQVRGLPDAPGVNRSYPPNDCSDLNQALKTYLDALTLPVFDKDAQPDLFTYQFAGYSGSFYLDDAGNAVELKKTTLKIQVTLSGSVTDSRYNCVIITPDGITYTFDAVEKTYSETIGTDYTGTLPTMNYVQTASFLTTIQHPVYGLILFQYISADAQGYTGVAQTYEASDPNNVINNGNSDACTAFNVLSTTKSKTYYQGMKLLASISNSVIGGGRLVFDYEDRKDLVGGKLLKAISLYSGNLKLKSVQLLYQQVRSAIPNNFSSFLAGDSALLYRYFLSQVRFLDAAAKEINRYSFAYYPPEDLPHRLNFSQDHAGYYNAKPNANSFLPPVTDATVPANLFPLATADREPDALAAQKGSISSITYPTGGKDSLEYELHRSTVTTESILNGSLNLLVRTASDETNKSATSAAVTITNVKDQPLTLTVKSLVAIGSTDPPPDPDVNYLHYVFTDVTSNTVMLQGDLNFYQQVNTKIYNFSPGHSFQLSLTVLVSNCRGSMSLVYATGTQQVSVVKLLPGLRIKRILTSDGSGNLSPK